MESPWVESNRIGHEMERFFATNQCVPGAI
jgi:hypothetical protein